LRQLGDRYNCLGRTDLKFVALQPCALEPLEARLLLSTAYEVWGGNTDYTGQPEHWDYYYNIDQQDYTKLGGADATATFSGNYAHYVIAARAFVAIDAVEGSTGAYASGVSPTGNTSHWDQIAGSPDGSYAYVGYQMGGNYAGFVVVHNPGDWTGLQVHVGSVRPTAKFSIGTGIEYNGLTTNKPYEFLVRAKEMGLGHISSVQFRSSLGVWYDMEYFGMGRGWYYSRTFTSLGDVAGVFPSGTYTMKMQSVYGQTTAEFFYGDKDTQLPLGVPTQVPVLLQPAMGATGVSSQPTFQWESVTDPNVTSIELEVFSAPDDKNVHREVLDHTTATTWSPGTLESSTGHEWFVNLRDYQLQETADGYRCDVENGISQKAYFHTANGTPRPPDLVANGASYTAGTYARSDEIALISFDAANSGGYAIAYDGQGNVVPFYLAAFLSTDRARSGDDIVVYRGAIPPLTEGGGEVPATFWANDMPQVPADAPSGDYYLGFMLDADGQIDEGADEGNNTWWSAAADIRVDAWQHCLTGDFDGLGRDDVVGRDVNGRWWVGLSNGTDFDNRRPWGKWKTSTTWDNVQLGDFNADGKADLIGRNEAGAWWVGLSTGTSFTSGFWGKWKTNTDWHNVQVGDFNGDGRDDVAGRNNRGCWWVSLAKASGNRFEKARFWGRWKTNTDWHDVQIGDFNADGKDDIAGRNDGGAWWVSAANVNGNRFQRSRFWGKWKTSSDWNDVQVGDFNGDGRDDVAGRNDAGRWWVSLANTAGNRFEQSRFWGSWKTNTDWHDVRIGLFNDDNYADIVGRNDNGSWWTSLADPTDGKFDKARFWGLWSTGTDWQDVQVGRFDGGDLADIIGRNDADEWWVSESLGNSFDPARLWGDWAP